MKVRRWRPALAPIVGLAGTASALPMAVVIGCLSGASVLALLALVRPPRGPR